MQKTLHFYTPEIKKHKWWLAGMLVSVFCISLTQTGYPFLFRELANIFSEEPSEQKIILVWQVFFKLFLLYTATFILWRFFEWVIITFESRGMRDIDQRCFAVIQKKSFRFFQEEHIGSLVKKAGRFNKAFEIFFDQLSFILFRNILDILIVLIIFSFQKPILGLFFGIWSALFIGGNYLFSRWKLKYEEMVSSADSKVGGVFTDSWGNFGAIKSFTQEEGELRRVEYATNDWEEKNRKSWLLNNLAFAIQSFLMIAMEITVIAVLIKGWSKGETNAGDFIFFEAFLIPLFRTLWDFGRNLRQLFRAIADAKEMGILVEQEEEIQDMPNAKNLLPQGGEIRFQNVQFSYAGDRQEIQNINLTIPAGQSVALVGHTGSGKTTLTKLLLRFFNISSGAIFIDGQNIANVTQTSLRKNISIVPQMPELFFRSVAENIAFGKPGASRQEIETAAQKAGAIDFISALPEGFNTLVGERGVKLSGGERQRIAIARAFLKDAPLLVLDEATSALDSVTEKTVQGAIETLLKDRTSIIIAHRLSTILQVDRILVLEKGKIREDGTHEELLKKKGKYAEMWSHQSGGFLQEEEESEGL